MIGRVSLFPKIEDFGLSFETEANHSIISRGLDDL
jgi:hypothetical protein